MASRQELAALPSPAERIQAILRTAQISQEELAALLGTDRPRVNAWARGRSVPSDAYAEKIAAFATEVYGEPIPARLFRDTPPGVRPVLVTPMIEDWVRQVIALPPEELADHAEVVRGLLRSIEAAAQENLAFVAQMEALLEHAESEASKEQSDQ